MVLGDALVVSLAGLIVLACAQSGPRNDPDAVESQSWRAVRLVQGEWNPGEGNYAPAGSGVLFVRGGRVFVVTNEHVVAKARKEIVLVYGGEAFRTEVRAVDGDYDLAILEAKMQPPLNPATRERTARVSEEQTLVAFGFPDAAGLTDSPVRIEGSVRWVGRFDPDKRQLVPGGPHTGRTVPAFLMSGKGCTLGSSGGPVFDQAGALVGYLKGMDNLGGCLGIEIAQAVSLLQRLTPAGGTNLRGKREEG